MLLLRVTTQHSLHERVEFGSIHCGRVAVRKVEVPVLCLTFIARWEAKTAGFCTETKWWECKQSVILPRSKRLCYSIDLQHGHPLRPNNLNNLLHFVPLAQIDLWCRLLIGAGASQLAILPIKKFDALDVVTVMIKSGAL